MPQGVHKTEQTAYRLPQHLTAWLREQADREGDGRTMTEIVIRALEAERDRCAGITTTAMPAKAVSPPRKQPPAVGTPRQRCTHQGTRIIGGYCKHCDHMIEPGGLWKQTGGPS